LQKGKYGNKIFQKILAAEISRQDLSLENRLPGNTGRFPGNRKEKSGPRFGNRLKLLFCHSGRPR
jgi:hypothetical protein